MLQNVNLQPSSCYLPGLPGFSSMFGKKKKRLEISAPSNFEHRVHTGFDPREQKFTGLPQQWQSLLADTANRPKPMVDPSYITPIQLAPMKVECEWTEGIKLGTNHYSFCLTLTSPFLHLCDSLVPRPRFRPHLCSTCLYKLISVHSFFPHHCSETIPFTCLSLPSHSV